MISVLMLIAGVTLSRALSDSIAGSVMGFVALPYAFVAGLLGPASKDATLSNFEPSQLMAGLAAVVMIAMISAFAIADGVPTFLGVTFAALMGTIGGAVAFLYGTVSAGGVAAVTIAL